MLVSRRVPSRFSLPEPETGLRDLGKSMAPHLESRTGATRARACAEFGPRKELSKKLKYSPIVSHLGPKCLAEKADEPVWVVPA